MRLHGPLSWLRLEGCCWLMLFSFFVSDPHAWWVKNRHVSLKQFNWFLILCGLLASTSAMGSQGQVANAFSNCKVDGNFAWEKKF